MDIFIPKAMTLDDLKGEPMAFDADGVILNFIKAFGKAASETLGREILCDGPSYSLAVKFGINEAELGRAWENFNRGGYWDALEALDGAIEAIDELQANGFRNIHVVTAIPEEFRADRHVNFQKLGFSPEAIHCVLHTTRYAKVPPITALRPFFFADDRIEHLHSNPQVPLLLHVDQGDEQFPDPQGRVDMVVPSLADGVRDFLNNPERWLEVVAANRAAAGAPAPVAPPTRPARRRSPK
jgi:hypothetical protein